MTSKRQQLTQSKLDYFMPKKQKTKLNKEYKQMKDFTDANYKDTEEFFNNYDISTDLDLIEDLKRLLNDE